MEDDVIFIRSEDETIKIVEQTLKFLKNHSEIEWNLLYLGYRNIQATHIYAVSHDPSINLWCASQVLSTTAHIVNKDPRSTEKLNKCHLNDLNVIDIVITHCLKQQFIHAYLIEPKLAQAVPGFSFSLNQQQDYNENNRQYRMLSNHTPPATFSRSKKAPWMIEKDA